MSLALCWDPQGGLKRCGLRAHSCPWEVHSGWHPPYHTNIYTNVTYDTTHTHYRASRVEKISLEEVKVPLLRIPGREGACP